MSKRAMSLGFVCLACLWLAGAAKGQSTVSGTCQIEVVKGRPGAYVHLQGWNIFMCRDGDGVTGQRTQVGCLPTCGQYSLSNSAGRYSMLLDMPLYFGRPKVVEDVVLPASGGIIRNLELPSDYLCAFGQEQIDWGSSPWTGYGGVWFQTFQATGTSITGVNFKLAGTNAREMDISILQSNGLADPTGWPQVGSSGHVRNLDLFVNKELPFRFRSGEVPTVPGQTYALRLSGLPGCYGSGPTFSIYRRLEDGQGYAAGTAYDASGTPQDFDLYAMIFCDSDNTLVSYCGRELNDGDLAGWAGRWCQEIRAMGTSLAAAEILFAGGDTWNKPITFKVRSGDANGPQVGAAKIGGVLCQNGDMGWAAATWNRGEVPLTPGQKYYLEVSTPAGFNPVKFTALSNVYLAGCAYKSGSLQADVDLQMQVVEYAPPGPLPTIDRSPTSFTRSIAQHDSLCPDTFTIANGGTGSLNYSISTDAEWLSVTPTSGQSVTETDLITVHYSTATLVPGSYQGVITITAPGADNTPQTVVVDLSVAAPSSAPCDFDHDSDCDQEDFGIFQRCMSAPGIPADPNCAD